MKEERLYIVGYMASGKSTFGRALAGRIGWKFIDIDEEVERREGRPVSDIITRDGEEAFRRLESEVLKQTASERHAVIACGGGTPCYRDNMEFMTLHGETLWLIATPERLAERILEAGPTRPLVAGLSQAPLMDHILAHLRQRQPYYLRAMWRHSGERLESQEEIEEAVNEFLESFNFPQTPNP